MTDYAQASAADPSWTWWMTTAAAAVRLRNLQHHHHHQGDGGGSGSSDVDDEFAGPGGKRQRVGDVYGGGGAGKDEYWPFERNNGLSHLRHRLDEPEDATSAGPLDLSVKATLTTTTATTTNATNSPRKRAGSDGYPAAAKTPEKRPAAAATTANRAGKSAKKTSTAAGAAASTTAVKAATRKLLPQLMLDRHVDRSSPVSGTIIVPAGSEEPITTAAGRKRPASYSPSLSSSSSLPSPPPYSAPMTDCAAAQDADDDYDGGDIDPEFNVVVATDEARRQIESIPNALGPYRCRLCGVRYVDAFALARHRCRCIVHVRYTCPECDKVFQCPANLASHRRWHGTGTAAAKTAGAGKLQSKNGDNNNGGGGSKPVNVVGDIAATIADVNDGDGTNSITTAPMTSVSGFKKNILQRAVQAAAAAAAAACNDNNNNDGGNDDNEKNKYNDDRGDIAK